MTPPPPPQETPSHGLLPFNTAPLAPGENGDSAGYQRSFPQ
jgi:hypothetical protein